MWEDARIVTRDLSMFVHPKPPKPRGSPIETAGGLADPLVAENGPLPRVLVVEDSAAQRKLLATRLSRWGFEVVSCATAEEGLSAADDPRIGLIISDWLMPGMTGPEFCRRLRASGRTSYQYVILLTSKSDTAALSEGLEAGADDFLTKPVVAPELRARLNAGARIVAMQGELVEKTRSLAAALGELRQLYDAIDMDLDEARRLQMSFLNDTYRRYDRADISLWLRASGHVGGDMVGFFSATQDVLGFYSMDVSGHGVAAAMVVARVAGMLSDGAPYQNPALSAFGGNVFGAVPPDLVASQFNSQLLAELKSERYLTMCLGFLDQRTGIVRLVQAGHPNPIIIRADGQIERVGRGGLPVGLFADARYETTSLRLMPGDRLVLYSDGLTECPVAGGGMLEEEGLIELCRLHAGLSGPDLLRAIADDVEGYVADGDFPDDVSALAVCYTGDPA